MKGMRIALRELARHTEFTDESRDLAAFLAAALQTVAESVDRSVEPWEKRGYWLKADRFRMDWAWVDPLARQMKKAVFEDDLASIAESVAKLGVKLKDVDVPEKHRLGQPWIGAWEKLKVKPR